MINLDASRLTISGTSTTGSQIGLSAISKNNALEISGTTVNNMPQNAVNLGCEGNDGSNGFGGCGSLQLSAASGAIQTLTLTDVLDPTVVPPAGGGDGWGFGLSYPTAPLTKAFNPTTIATGGTSQLTFTIANPNNFGQGTLSPLDFTDNLPSGVTLANGTVTNNGNCGTPTVTDATGGGLGSGDAGVKAGSISVAQGATCTITINVTSNTPGSYTNNNTNLSTGVANLIPNANTTLTVAAPPPTWSCSSFGYLFQTPNATTHQIVQVDLATGQFSTYGTTTDALNAVGYNALDNYMYGWDAATDQLVRIGSDGTLTPLPRPSGIPAGAFSIGDVDSNGHYWVWSGTAWYEIDLAPGSATYGQLLGSGTATYPSGVLNVPDWAYINGALYGVGTTTTASAQLVKFNPASGQWSSLGSLAGVAGTDAYGAVYADAAGNLWASANNSGTISRIDLATVKSTASSTGPSSAGNDGARCASAPIPTITVTKQVAGRVVGADQFTVALKNSGGTTLTSATTSGTQSSASTTDWPVTQGATYTITDAMASGSSSVIGAYSKSIACAGAGGNPVPTSGSGPSWTITVPGTSAYTCTISNTPPAPGPAWSCDAFGYLFQTPTATTHGIYQVDLATGAYTTFGTTADYVNGVGYNVLDDYMYGWDGTTNQLVRIARDGSLAQLGVASGIAPADVTAGFNVGDVDSAGHLFVVNGGSPHPNPATWYEIDLAPGSATYGAVIDKGSMSFPANVSTLNDWSYSNGALYGVSSGGTGGASDLVRFDPATSTLTDLGPATGLPNTGLFGASYTDAAGHLYVSENSTGEIYRVDVSTRAGIAVSAGPASGLNDGARCAKAPIPTITVTKQVAGRVQAGDQFAVGLKNSGGTTLTSATTATTQTSVSTTNWPVSQGATYTITDAMKAGSPDALSAYTASISCTDKAGNPASTGGSAPNWTLNVADPTDYTCVVTNAPGTKSYTVTKSASTSGPVHPGDTITYTVVVQNTGPVPYTAGSPATYTDSLGDVIDDAAYNNDATNGATVSGSTLSWSGALAALGSPGDSASITYSFTVYSPDVGNSVLKNVVVGGTNCPAGSTDPACGTVTKVQSYRVVKSTTATEVTPGEVVPYTITVTNTGSVDYTAANPATWSDDLTGVLDDATYGNDATASGGTVTYSAPTLSWSGALAVGTPITITYSVTVNNPDTGDKTLENAVVTSDPGGNCPPGSPNPDCNTVVPEQQFKVVKSASVATAKPGDKITYTITVTNTGQVAYTAANPATFSDDLTGVLDDAVYNHDAAVTAGTVSYTSPSLSWAGALPVKGIATITYTVTVDKPDPGDAQLRNVVTTPSDGSCGPGSTDPGCVNQVPVQQFTANKTASSSQATPGDKVTYTITVQNTGQVDYTAADPAGVTDDLSAVLDDATYNNDAAATNTGVQPAYSAPVLSWSGPLGIGDTVTITYSIKVNKPDTGDHTLSNAISGPFVCAKPPCGPVVIPVADYTVTKTASVSTANSGDKVTYTVTVHNTGQVDYTAASPATFSDDLSGVLDDATYNDDASSGATYAAPVISWSGPLAIGDTTTVTYSVTVDKPDTGDHSLKNAVTGGQCTQPSTDPACHTITPVADYTVTKTASATSANPGDTITYTVTVHNTGQVTYTAGSPATFSDDLSGVLDDATFGSATNGATFSAPSLSWSGPLAVGGMAIVTYTVTVNKPDTGDHTLKNAVSGGQCTQPSTDPACGTITPVTGYTVTKTADKSTAGPGDKVTYTVIVHNSGQVAYTAASPATFSDDLSGVLDDATYNNDATNGATFSAPTLSWSGALGIGKTITITYSVTVDKPDTGDHTLKNAVSGGQCTQPSTDPACGTITPVAEYTVTKTASATTVNPGDKITYTITVHNTGAVDYTAADPATVTDNLAQVLDDATYNNDATSGATYSAPVLSWAAALGINDTVTITYSVTLDNPDAGDGDLPNAVIGGGCTSPSDPGCHVDPKVQAYKAVKTADKATVTPGEKITYTITLTNTGKVPYTAADPASYTDDLSNVLDDATYNDDATNGATYAAPVLSWSGPLDVGQILTVTYSVTVNSPDTGDQKLANTVVTASGGGNCPTAMAAPTAAPRALAAAPTADTNPDCTAKVPGNQLRVTKTSSATTAAPGQTVTYTITVKNTGQTDFTTGKPATFTDDLSGVLDDARYNGDASNGAAVSGARLSWSGPLVIGDTVTVTYSVTVNKPDAGDKRLKNVVSLPPGENSNCSPGSTDPMCSTDTPVKQYTVVKKASAAQVNPGDTVSYTITVTNTGQVAYTSSAPASFTDDLSSVLDDASYNHDATSGATLSGHTLTWSGALPVAGAAKVTYSVTVHDPDTGDGKLHNVVTTPGSSGANCPTGSTNPDCHTDTAIAATPPPAPDTAIAATPPPAPVGPRPNPGGGIAFTGNDSQLELILAGLLVGVGGLFVLAGLRHRRRRTG